MRTLSDLFVDKSTKPMQVNVSMISLVSETSEARIVIVTRDKYEADRHLTSRYITGVDMGRAAEGPNSCAVNQPDGLTTVFTQITCIHVTTTKETDIQHGTTFVFDKLN